ncbi:ankyrin repeat domain-containing protein [soil metagenome]
MSVHRLPDNPDLEHLRNQAKRLLRQIHADSPDAMALVSEHHPHPPRAAKLADAQLITARMYGFASWPKLEQHVDTVARYTRSPHRVVQVAAPSDEFLRLACLTYGDDSPGWWREAEQLLPAVADASVFTMAATGSFDTMRAALAEDSTLARASGGPFDWEPLLYLCYSRLPVAAHYLETAQLLLDHGADPNAGYLWDGLTSPFTALTGAFGGGEADQPPHPAGIELARLLLSAGADANDSQTLYNLGLGGSWSDDTAHLEVLLSFGLGRGDGGPWKQRLGPTMPTPQQMIRDELATAALRGGPRRARLLLDHGADPDGIGGHPAFGGRTPYQLAQLHGHVDVAEILAATGASGALDDAEQFVASCMLGDRTVADGRPDLLAQVLTRAPDLVNRAAEHGNISAATLLVDLGFDVNHLARTTPLHAAAWNDDVDMARALIALGADPSIEDVEHHSAPLGWAEYGGKTRIAAYLRSL